MSDSRKTKQLYCDYCGEPTRVGRLFPGDIESCGAAECEREINSSIRAQEAEAFEPENDGTDWTIPIVGWIR